MGILKVLQMVAHAMAIIILITTKANSCSKLISQVNLKKCLQPSTLWGARLSLKLALTFIASSVSSGRPVDLEKVLSRLCSSRSSPTSTCSLSSSSTSSWVYTTSVPKSRSYTCYASSYRYFLSAAWLGPQRIL